MSCVRVRLMRRVPAAWRERSVSVAGRARNVAAGAVDSEAERTSTSTAAGWAVVRRFGAVDPVLETGRVPWLHGRAGPRTPAALAGAWLPRTPTAEVG